MSDCIVSTTVEVVFSAAHVDPVTGALHGHDYRVRATFESDGTRFETLKASLTEVLKELDHTTMVKLFSAEQVSRWVMRNLPDAYVVEVDRPWLGHYVKAVRCGRSAKSEARL